MFFLYSFFLKFLYTFLLFSKIDENKFYLFSHNYSLFTLFLKTRHREIMTKQHYKFLKTNFHFFKIKNYHTIKQALILLASPPKHGESFHCLDLHVSQVTFLPLNFHVCVVHRSPLSQLKGGYTRLEKKGTYKAYQTIGLKLPNLYVAHSIKIQGNFQQRFP